MKILVSGGCGFIGHLLIKRLKELGHTIICVDSIIDALNFADEQHNYDEFHDWKEVHENSKYDFLDGVEFAYLLGGTDSNEIGWESIRHSNCDSPSALITMCNLRSIPIVYASSSNVYGADFKRRCAIVNPLRLVGKSKLMMEKFISYFPLPNVIALRYHNVYGGIEESKGNRASIVYRWFKNYSNGILTNNLFHGSDKIKRDFIHVDDLNDINIMFLDFYIKYNQLPDVSILDVGSGRASSFDDVAREIMRHTKGSAQYIISPYNSKNYQQYTRANIKGISDTYKWLYDKEFEPLNLNKGIAKTFRDYFKK